MGQSRIHLLQQKYMVKFIDNVQDNPCFYISGALVLALLSMTTYDAYLFFKMKVYKTYSTSSILLSCMALLIFRVICSVFILLNHNPDSKETTLEADLLGDIPWCIMSFITLCLIFQWKEISKWLLDPVQALKDAESGRNRKQLVTVQVALAMCIIVDITIMLLWRYGWILQSKLEFMYGRAVINFTFLAITIALFVWTVLVYKSMKRSLEKNELMTSLCKQVNTFFTIVLLILSLRAVATTVISTLWILNQMNELIDYTDKREFYMGQLFVDSTIEIVLNYFLIYHLFRNQSLPMSDVTDQTESKQSFKQHKTKYKGALPIHEDSVKDYSRPFLEETQPKLKPTKAFGGQEGDAGKSSSLKPSQETQITYKSVSGPNDGHSQSSNNKRESNGTVSDTDESDQMGFEQTIDKFNNIRADRKREGSLDISGLQKMPQPRLKIDDSVASSNLVRFSKHNSSVIPTEMEFHCQTLLSPHHKNESQKTEQQNPFSEPFKIKSATYVMAKEYNLEGDQEQLSPQNRTQIDQSISESSQNPMDYCHYMFAPKGLLDQLHQQMANQIQSRVEQSASSRGFGQSMFTKRNQEQIGLELSRRTNTESKVELEGIGKM